MEILVVDDHPMVREILASVLQRAFGEVSIVAVGDLQSAFQQLAHHKAPDLALLDLELPGNQGIDTLRRFRWKFPNVPVVVVSATEDAKSVRVALEQGAVGYLPKSLATDTLVAALQEIAAGQIYAPPVANKPAANK